MPDHHLLEDQAVLYVQGHLTDAERAEFKTQLAQSAELRALVHELEEGAVVLAAAVPQRRPPPHVWQQIERTVAGETKRKVETPLFWIRWLQNGWAAAAACLVGWLLYATWVHRAATPVPSPSQVAAEAASTRESTALNSFKTQTEGAMPQSSAMTNTGRQPQINSPAQMEENALLRRQIAGLENRVTHLSETVTQQQTLLSESSRLKFFRLVPSSEGGTGAPAAIPSAEQQRALFLAMARELGWIQSTNGYGQESQSRHLDGSPTNFAGIDFVNLHPDASETTHLINPSVVASSTDTPDMSPSISAIPGFVSGTNVVMIVGTSAAPIGSLLTFWSSTAGQGSQPLGTAVLANNTLVVTIPMGNMPPDGLNITVTTSAPSGSSNTVGPFVEPVTPPQP
jgi:uncharacterized coiled-coil protein SlyX